MPNWKEILYELILICLGDVGESKFKEEVKTSPPRRRKRLARRMQFRMLLGGSSFTEANAASEMIWRQELDDEEVDELWQDFASWKSARKKGR